jgi:hypothetical protein
LKICTFRCNIRCISVLYVRVIYLINYLLCIERIKTHKNARKRKTQFFGKSSSSYCILELNSTYNTLRLIFCAYFVRTLKGNYFSRYNCTLKAQYIAPLKVTISADTIGSSGITIGTSMRIVPRESGLRVPGLFAGRCSRVT